MSENWHKRHALQLASQLPENASDANAVIRELRHLVDTWLDVAPEPMKASVTVLRAVSSSGASDYAPDDMSGDAA
jgi:hypothetical protein